MVGFVTLICYNRVMFKLSEPDVSSVDAESLFAWVSCLFLSTNVLRPVNNVYHVTHARNVVAEDSVSGVVQSPVKVLCGGQVKGKFEDGVPGFVKLEAMIDSIDKGVRDDYSSWCRECLTQASFLTLASHV